MFGDEDFRTATNLYPPPPADPPNQPLLRMCIRTDDSKRMNSENKSTHRIWWVLFVILNDLFDEFTIV
jgi:hypothetical protein